MSASHARSFSEILGRSPIHPFPARMAPGIALEALAEGPSPLRVLDPMAGSGTVIAVARALGHVATGIDIDPLAVLLANVWTRTIDPTSVRAKAETVLSRAKRTFDEESSGRSYPHGSDDETRCFIRYWFDDYARKQLYGLSRSIRGVRDRVVQDALWCGFSRLIVTKQAGASLAMDLSHSRPHRSFYRAPVKPFSRFLSAVDSVVANCPQKGARPLGPPTLIKCGDARCLTTPDASIDLVLTSPPYLNAIDYMRCSKFTLVWMGYTIQELREIRGESIGAERASGEASDHSWVNDIVTGLKLSPSLPRGQEAMLTKYIWDMSQALSEVSRVLKVGGNATYVVGDSTIRGTFVRNSEVVRVLGERFGLSLVSKRSRVLPSNRRYLPPPSNLASNPMEQRMRREVILKFAKITA